MKILFLLGFAALAFADVPLENRGFDPKCAACKEAIKKIESKFLSNATEAQVASELHDLCNEAPGNLASQCNSLVDQDLDQIFNAIKNKLDPDAICKMIGLCSQKSNNMRFIASAFADVPRKNKGSNSVCGKCKDIVKQIESQVFSDTTEADIAKALHDLCKQAPAGLQSQCDNLVDQDLDQIFNAIKNKLDPDAVCKMIHVCSQKLNNLQFDNVPEVNKGFNPKCGACKRVVQNLESKVLNGATEDDVKNELHKLCDDLPFGSSKCISIVDNNLDKIFDAIKQKLDPEAVCKMIHLCSQKSNGMQFDDVPEENKGFNPKCGACKRVVQNLESKVFNGATEDDIKKELHKLCDDLPFGSSKCISIVDNNLDKIFEAIKNKLEPEAVCKMIHLCSQKSNNLQFDDVQQENKGFNPKCGMCKAVVQRIESQVFSGSGEDEIKNELHKFCNNLRFGSSKCISIVDNNLDKILDAIKNKLDPEAVCEKIHLCSQKSNENQVIEVASHRRVSPQCRTCIYVVQKLEDKILNNATGAQVANTLHELCNNLTFGSQACNNLVNQSLNQILNAIKQHLNASAICTMIGQCSQKSSNFNLAHYLKPVLIKGMNYCPMCHFLSGAAAAAYTSPEFQKEFMSSLKVLCHTLPHGYINECKGIVSQSAPEIYKVLSSELHPNRMCHALMQC